MFPPIQQIFKRLYDEVSSACEGQDGGALQALQALVAKHRGSLQRSELGTALCVFASNTLRHYRRDSSSLNLAEVQQLSGIIQGAAQWGPEAQTALEVTPGLLTLLRQLALKEHAEGAKACGAAGQVEAQARSNERMELAIKTQQQIKCFAPLLFSYLSKQGRDAGLPRGCRKACIGGACILACPANCGLLATHACRLQHTDTPSNLLRPPLKPCPTDDELLNYCYSYNIAGTAQIEQMRTAASRVHASMPDTEAYKIIMDAAQACLRVCCCCHSLSSCPAPMLRLAARAPLHCMSPYPRPTPCTCHTPCRLLLHLHATPCT